MPLVSQVPVLSWVPLLCRVLLLSWVPLVSQLPSCHRAAIAQVSQVPLGLNCHMCNWCLWFCSCSGLLFPQASHRCHFCVGCTLVPGVAGDLGANGAAGVLGATLDLGATDVLGATLVLECPWCLEVLLFSWLPFLPWVLFPCKCHGCHSFSWICC